MHPSRPTGGAYASSRTRGGMRWTQAVPDEGMRRADGEVVWSCPPDAGVKFAGDDPASDGG